MLSKIERLAIEEYESTRDEISRFQLKRRKNSGSQLIESRGVNTCCAPREFRRMIRRNRIVMQVDVSDDSSDDSSCKRYIEPDIE